MVCLRDRSKEGLQRSRVCLERKRERERERERKRERGGHWPKPD
jgi:hypothetical protein